MGRFLQAWGSQRGLRGTTSIYLHRAFQRWQPECGCFSFLRWAIPSVLNHLSSPTPLAGLGLRSRAKSAFHWDYPPRTHPRNRWVGASFGQLFQSSPGWGDRGRALWGGPSSLGGRPLSPCSESLPGLFAEPELVSLNFWPLSSDGAGPLSLPEEEVRGRDFRPRTCGVSLSSQNEPGYVRPHPHLSILT